MKDIEYCFPRVLLFMFIFLTYRFQKIRQLKKQQVQASVVQKADNFIHWIRRNTVDITYGKIST